MNLPKREKDSHWLIIFFKQEKDTIVDLLILEVEQKWPLWEEDEKRQRGRERENDIEKTLKLNCRITRHQINQYYD